MESEKEQIRKSMLNMVKLEWWIRDTPLYRIDSEVWETEMLRVKAGGSSTLLMLADKIREWPVYKDDWEFVPLNAWIESHKDLQYYSELITNNKT
jgi:hypothetical protein